MLKVIDTGCHRMLSCIILVVAVASLYRFRLALQAAYAYRDQLQSQWQYLPLPLADLLNTKLHGGKPEPSEEGQLQGKTCIIS